MTQRQHQITQPSRKPALLIYTKGVSLIELMITLLIGLVLIGGVIQVYISNFHATRTISGLSSQQENTRIALHVVTSAIQLAGHYGSVNNSDISTLGTLGLTGIGGCDEAWLTDVSMPIQGFEGGSAISNVVNFPSNCIPTSQYVPNSDIIVVRYGSPTQLTALTNLKTNKVYLRTAASQGLTGGEILTGSSKDSSHLGNGLDGVGIYNYEYKADIFFLRPCSALNDSSCTDGINTLVRYRFDGLTLTADTIAEHVEQFQIAYGEDTDNNNVADSWNGASSVINWNNVISTKINLIIRSEQINNQHNDNNTYAMVSDYTFTPSDDKQRYHRKLISKAVPLRNIRYASGGG